MRSLVSTLLIVGLAFAIGFGGNSPQVKHVDASPSPAIVEPVAAAPSLDCKCDVCKCDLIGKVPAAPVITPVATATPAPDPLPTKLVEPPAGLKVKPTVAIVPVAAKVKAAAQPVASGHWETVYSGFRGRRSYQRWVPHSPSSSAQCANGSCSTQQQCANGNCSSPPQQQLMYFSSGGACRSCR